MCAEPVKSTATMATVTDLVLGASGHVFKHASQGPQLKGRCAEVRGLAEAPVRPGALS